MIEPEPDATLENTTSTGEVSGTDLSTMFRRDASAADRARALQAFGTTVRARLQDVTVAAGHGAEVVAERSGQLLSEVVDRIPIRRVEDLRREFGDDPQIRAQQVIDDAAALARWVWAAAKAIPAPEPTVHAAKVVLHSAIEIRMVGELLEANRDANVDGEVTPLPTILTTWVHGEPGGPAWSASSVATILRAQTRRALQELRGRDGRLKTVMTRGREGADIVRGLGEKVNDAIRRGAVLSDRRALGRGAAADSGRTGA